MGPKKQTVTSGPPTPAKASQKGVDREGGARGKHSFVSGASDRLGQERECPAVDGGGIVEGL